MVRRWECVHWMTSLFKIGSPLKLRLPIKTWRIRICSWNSSETQLGSQNVKANANIQIKTVKTLWEKESCDLSSTLGILLRRCRLGAKPRSKPPVSHYQDEEIQTIAVQKEQRANNCYNTVLLELQEKLWNPLPLPWDCTASASSLFPPYIMPNGTYERIKKNTIPSL